MRLRPLTLACLTSLAVLHGCALGPDFQRPEIAVPTTFSEAKGWKTAEPQDQIAPNAWWELYGDSRLNELVQQVEISNQNVLAAAAQYRQAQALVSASRAAWFPTLGGTLSAFRGQGTTSGTSISPGSPVRDTDRIGLSSTWEVDLWGRISRTVEANTNAAQASAGDLAAARISAQATLVQSYLQLRINDAQQRLLATTLSAYQRSFEITGNRYQAGVASKADVALAETQLKSTQAQFIDLGIQRAQLEHAIALLVGKMPAELKVAAVDEIPTLPEIPLALPSSLLERRPDVAAAERRAAAANAQIGVAQAAFFPSLIISANGGYQNASFVNLLSTPYRFWSLGPALALSIFDAGARSAAKEQAIAAYDKNVASYRQTVLTAFQEVEDNLATLSILAEEKEVQKAAGRAAKEFQTQANNQYLAGTVSYLNVATAQAASLNAERSSLDILNRQLSASVALLKALGGGDWRSTNESRPADRAG